MMKLNLFLIMISINSIKQDPAERVIIMSMQSFICGREDSLICFKEKSLVRKFLLEI